MRSGGIGPATVMTRDAMADLVVRRGRRPACIGRRSPGEMDAAMLPRRRRESVAHDDHNG
jgi:hypothetical protein